MRRYTEDEEADMAAVSAMKRAWDQLFPREMELRAELAELEKEWGPRKASDPIVIPVDLLSPLAQERRETAHTQTLRYLLDPAEPHGFDEVLLDWFFNAVASVLPEEEAATFVSALERCDHDEVLAERACFVELDGSIRAGRTDLWIEAMEGEVVRAIVVVENKVGGAPETEQLRAYDRVIEERIRSLSHSPVCVKILLSSRSPDLPAESVATGWRSLSYLNLALHWTRALDTDASEEGRTYLRLYLATIFQRLHGLKWTPTPRRSDLQHFVAYLRIRLGKESK